MPIDESADNRGLITALTAAALHSAAPDELVVLDETADEYFADPQALLNPKSRDEAVGFGIEMGLIAPFVLAVATPVVQFLIDTVTAAAQDAAKPMVTRAVRRLIRWNRSEPDGTASVSLSMDQVRRARSIAYDQARRLGLPERDCVLLADSVAGGLAM